MVEGTHRIASGLGHGHRLILAAARSVLLLTGLGILTASAVRAQDQSSSTLLERARDKIARSTHQLLKCACLETCLLYTSDAADE